MRYQNNIVKKPWGYEYLAYQNKDVAIWLLYIKNSESTSMHCHPNKTTGLALLGGTATVSFLSNKFDLNPQDKLMIRKGLFHSTLSTSPEGIYLLEIETPVDKYDLVRFKDSYGREGKPYEDSTFEYPKEEDCIWIEDPTERSVYTIGNTNLVVSAVKDISFFKDIKDDRNIIFLQGGIMTEYDINVVSPGDIVSCKVIKQLVQVFNKIDEGTVAIVMEKNV